MSNSNPSIGWIGIGRMGYAMAERVEEVRGALDWLTVALMGRGLEERLRATR